MAADRLLAAIGRQGDQGVEKRRRVLGLAGVLRVVGSWAALLGGVRGAAGQVALGFRHPLGGVRARGVH